MAGEPIKYWTVEREDKLYAGRGHWVDKEVLAAHMTETLAIAVSRRYPGSTVEQQFGYEVHFRTSLDQVGEPETQAAVASAVRLAKRDGWSLETLMLQTEKAFHAGASNGNQS